MRIVSIIEIPISDNNKSDVKQKCFCGEFVSLATIKHKLIWSSCKEL